MSAKKEKFIIIDPLLFRYAQSAGQAAMLKKL